MDWRWCTQGLLDEKFLEEAHKISPALSGRIVQMKKAGKAGRG